MYPIKLLAIIAVALLLHLTLGWAWTFAAGIAAGTWHGRGGWRLGAMAVGIDWGLLMIYSYAVDARAVHLMTRTLGGILGNLPFYAVVVSTLFIGIILGGMGGGVGTHLRYLLTRTGKTRAAA